MEGNLFIFKSMLVLSKLSILSSFHLKINTFVFTHIHYHSCNMKCDRQRDSVIYMKDDISLVGNNYFFEWDYTVNFVCQSTCLFI
jgi:hypothetical protein